MKIQLLSDLHVEFADYPYPDCDCDVVVLAGDIHLKDKGFQWAREHIKDTPVIYVLGNHEYYGHIYPKLTQELKELAAGTNIHVLENDSVTIDGVNFFGCTLWTNFELFGNARITGHLCQQLVTDYLKIRRLPTYSKIRSLDVASINKVSVQWLNEALELHDGQTNVVVTHHGPSLQSIPPHRRDEMISAAYVSNLEHLIREKQPECWLHGHVHSSSDYSIGDCRVVCNPKGYENKENPGYQPHMTIEV